MSLGSGVTPAWMLLPKDQWCQYIPHDWSEWMPHAYYDDEHYRETRMCRRCPASQLRVNGIPVS